MHADLFNELLESVREAGQIRRGARAASRRTLPSELGLTHLDIPKVRARLNLSRGKFAKMMGISERTLEGWEQRRRDPDGPARVLLQIAATHPEVVLQTVAKLPKTQAGARGGYMAARGDYAVHRGDTSVREPRRKMKR